MKKFLWLFLILLFTGCGDLSNTPNKRVEEFLRKYQMLDSEVLNDLDNAIAQDATLTPQQAETYRDIMKSHYQKLTYEIKDDKIDGDRAQVTVEITVTDLRNILSDAEAYMNAHMSEFFDENGVYSVSKYNDYRLEELKKANEKVQYTIYFNLGKVDKKWQLDNLDQITYDKINGIYK